MRFFAVFSMFAGLLLLSVGCTASDRSRIDDQESAGQSLPAIGVAEFVVRGRLDARAGRVVSDLLSEVLADGKGLRAVGSDAIGTVDVEEDLGALGPEGLGLDALVLGTVKGLGSRKMKRNYLWMTRTESLVTDITVDIRCIDVHTADILYSSSGSRSVRQRDRLGILGFDVAVDDSDAMEKALRAALRAYLDREAADIGLVLDRRIEGQEAGDQEVRDDES